MRNLYQKLTNVLLSAFIMLISFNASATNYYVDGSVSSSGDGLSWATAFKTISEAVSLSLSGGDAVYIQPGLYHEQITIHASGTSILAATANISVSAGGIVQFPSGTNLSAIDLIGHPDEYYAYVARSMKSNNGVYKIIAVDDANDRITVELTGDDFLAESGTAGDLYSLSAAIVRPIRHINASATPETQRVIIEGDAGMNGAVYIGANNTGDDAIPANYNLMDGFDITGIPAGFGLNITCSMYNAILNTNIYENGSSDKGGGVIVNGHDPFLASYNFFERVKIYDVNCEGAYLGNGNHTPEYNVTNFNHLIDCEFYQTHPPLNFENGPDLKEDNTGTVIEGCLFHDLTLSSAYNGVINVFERNTHVMIYGNEFYNINSYLVSSEDIYNAYVVTYQEIDNLMFFNNILRSPGNVNSTFHALYFHDTNIDNAYFAFNTITGFNNCIMQDGGGSSMHVMSNIFDCDNYTDWGSGSYNFSNNLFKVAPPWGLGTGDKVGTPGFVGGGDYHLTSSSIARNAGTQTTPVVPLDFDLLPRDVTPDIGAYEFQSTIIIASTSSLPAFPQTAITTSSAAQSFTASGTGLTANITVTAPAEFEVSLTEGSGYGSSVTLTQSGGTVATTTIYARFSPTTVGNKSGNIVLSSTGATSVNVAVSGEAVAVLTPTIIASTATLPAFPQTVIATSSAAQSFTASGTGLTANITVTAPAEFEVSLTEGSGYGSSVTLTQSGGTVATTTIYARFSPTTVGNKSGNIVLSSTGATSVNVAVSGEAVTTTPGLWTGAVSTDWNTTGNWDDNNIPLLTTDVTIPSGLTNYPVIGATTQANCNNLNLATGTTLVLASDATGTGSLIVNGTLANNGTITSQRYLPGANQAWHMVGSPVNSLSIGGSSFNPGATDDFYAWDEPSPGTWVNFKNQDGSQGNPSFPVANGDNNFHAGKGYLIAYDAANPVKTFIGTPTTGTVNFTLSYHAVKSDWIYNSGWNLVSNPYPSSIDWTLADKSDLEDNFAYIYDPNLGGGEGYTTTNSIIGPHQGYMVWAKPTANGASFSFTNSMKTHGGMYLKNPVSNDNQITLRLSGADHYNETSIWIDQNTQFNHDRDDALKLFSFNPNIPQLFSFSSDGAQLAINSIPFVDAVTTVDLGFLAPHEDSYTISLTEQSTSINHLIYLEDKLSGEMHNLTQHSYSFASGQGQINDRFTLHFGVTGIEHMEMSNIQLYCANSTLYIQGGAGQATLEIFDITGKRLISKQVVIDGTYSETLNLGIGMYFARISNNHQFKTTKVIIK